MAGKKKEEAVKTAVVSSKKMSMLDINAELKKEADAIKTRIGTPGGDLIRVSNDKKFTFPDGTKSGDPFRAVILDFVSINYFYDKEFKPGEGGIPSCFAISKEPKGMVPSSNSPKKEAEACDICPNNEFGSNGAGKACGNGRLLALVEDSDNEEAPIRLLKVSATAIKGFDAYVKTIQTQFDMPPIGVVTEIYFDPNAKHATLRFGNPEPNTNLQVHYGRKAGAMERLLTEPDVSQYKPPVAKPAKKR